MIRGEEFKIDSNIPVAYLCGQIIVKSWSLLNGLLITQRPNFISTSARILCKSKIRWSVGANIQEGARIDALSREGVVIGRNFSLGKNSFIECSGTLRHVGVGLKIEDNVGVGSNSFLGCAGGVQIGENTIIGNFVSFHSENHIYKDKSKSIRNQGVSNKGIVVGKDCWIGAKVTFLDGCVLGDGSVVAAGAVLKGEEYPANSLIAGVPAVVKKINLRS